MKKISLIMMLAAVCLLMVSCTKGTRVVKEEYSKGKPFIVYYIKNNVKVYEEHYYENGEMRCKGACNGTERKGKWKFYYDNGEKFATCDFTGVKEGKDWKFYDSKGEILADNSDRLLSISFSDEGTPVSIKVKKSSGEYKDREVYMRFFNSFHLMERWLLKGNIPQGEAMSWFEDGNVNSVHYYKDGMLDSIYTVYSENGNPITKGQYKKGIKTGKWEYFNSNGRPAGVEIYDDYGTKLQSRDDEALQGIKYIHASDTLENNKKADGKK